ncbi:MAG: threonine synthase [Bradymonadaceae bacterium]|nr:threonine synthase [Lujinxingiaceae bacterium]
MKFVSTRNASPSVTLSQALSDGLAPDGGLYVPEALPRFAVEDFVGLERVDEIGARLLAPFFEGDALADSLAQICKEALNFALPLKRLDEQTSILELFHGPTAAFKDVGARFLASCLSRLAAGDARPLTILVATSGDTGGAVASAFHQKPNIEVQVLYPLGKVSPRQEHQLTCWGDNVRAFAVRGVFDDCQRLVKDAFADPWWRENKRLSSANSINIGRVLPQMIYYACASLWHFRQSGQNAGFVIPTGNLGNALACMWAHEMGLPIREIMLATNANRPIVDFLGGSGWQPRPSVSTLASAMDVGDPSNMERVRHLFADDDALRTAIRALSVDDAMIEETIRDGLERYREVFCPHTAVAMCVREQLPATPWIVVATAHPAKFEQIVEPLIGRPVEIPPALASLFERPAHHVEIAAQLNALTGEQ